MNPAFDEAEFARHLAELVRIGVTAGIETERERLAAWFEETPDQPWRGQEIADALRDMPAPVHDQ